MSTSAAFFCEYLINMHGTSATLLPKLLFTFYSNQAIRQHINTTRGLFPHKRITRRSELTARGLVVTEHEEEVTPLQPSSSAASPHSSHINTNLAGNANTKSAADEAPSPTKRSPISELLYVRWLEGLKLKWPNIM